MHDEILFRNEGGVASITINCPERGNRFSDEMTLKFTSRVKESEDGARLIIVRAEGDDFCLGRQPGGKRTGDALDRRRQGEAIFDCYAALRESRIPVIGLVRGRAFGFGCAVAASCDLTLAEEDASFGLPELAHNVMPGNAMSALVDRVSRKAITLLSYSTRPVSAQDAMMMGIVSKVVPRDSLEQSLDELVSGMLTMPQAAIEAVKEYVMTAPGLNSQAAVQFARYLHATINSAREVQHNGKEPS